MSRLKLSAILRILVSLLLLGFLLTLARKNFSEIWILLRSANIRTFIAAFLVFMLSVFCISLRLNIALSVQTNRLPLKDLFSLTLIGYFFTNFMPTSIGGDLVKGYYISKRIESKLSSYSAIFVDRIIGMFSLALIALCAVLVIGKDIEHPIIFWSVGLLLGICLTLILLLTNKGLVKRIGNVLGIGGLLQKLNLDSAVKKAYASVNIYKDHKQKILQIVALSLVTQTLAFFSTYLLSLSLGLDISFGKFFLILPIIFVLCMIPVTMNGLGLREWAFVLFFGPNIGEPAALSLSLLYLAVFLLVSLVGGIIYLFWR